LDQETSFGKDGLASNQRGIQRRHLIDDPPMPSITTIEICDQWPGVDDDARHSPNPERCFGLVDRSLGPSMTPQTSANASWQLVPLSPALTL
jgi:hypothetical protein